MLSEAVRCMRTIICALYTLHLIDTITGMWCGVICMPDCAAQVMILPEHYRRPLPKDHIMAT